MNCQAGCFIWLATRRLYRTAHRLSGERGEEAADHRKHRSQREDQPEAADGSDEQRADHRTEQLAEHGSSVHDSEVAAVIALAGQQVGRGNGATALV